MTKQERERLVSNLMKEGYIKSQEVKNAFLTIHRELFIPDEIRSYAYADTPLDIGFGQTISAPHMVAIMAETLDIKKGQKILEIGTGSGYHAAVVASLVGSEGHVYTIERFDSLASNALKNITKAEIHNVTIEVGDGSLGVPAHQPYDRIYVTAASPSIPPPLVDQLNDPGKLLIPVGDMYCELLLLEKKHNKISQHRRGGCVFVPLVGKYGH
jgi:protein-L-isoaspartate(D-aspartate) O-methyltransferase